ncbi:hypothetical protein SAMN05443248_3506 [Bradyrhizobium erythrophlei]|uniref:Uncharacterized protein n=1 Tax=Bradyrhizobium erythrophlei TaxID=1437360 RepID=A0A1M5PU67_9BRAD|nr:hypothetical protein SAMN05443248_3506 [Bradyrhizobium erythrophlei]
MDHRALCSLMRFTRHLEHLRVMYISIMKNLGR